MILYIYHHNEETGLFVVQDEEGTPLAEYTSEGEAALHVRQLMSDQIPTAVPPEVEGEQPVPDVAAPAGSVE